MAFELSFKAHNMVSVQPYSSKPGPVNGQSQCYLSFDGVKISISSNLKLALAPLSQVYPLNLYR